MYTRDPDLLIDEKRKFSENIAAEGVSAWECCGQPWSHCSCIVISWSFVFVFYTQDMYDIGALIQQLLVRDVFFFGLIFQTPFYDH